MRSYSPSLPFPPREPATESADQCATTSSGTTNDTQQRNDPEGPSPAEPLSVSVSVVDYGGDEGGSDHHVVVTHSNNDAAAPGSVVVVVHEREGDGDGDRVHAENHTSHNDDDDEEEEEADKRGNTENDPLLGTETAATTRAAAASYNCGTGAGGSESAGASGSSSPSSSSSSSSTLHKIKSGNVVGQCCPGLAGVRIPVMLDLVRDRVRSRALALSLVTAQLLTIAILLAFSAINNTSDQGIASSNSTSSSSSNVPLFAEASSTVFLSSNSNSNSNSTSSSEAAIETSVIGGVITLLIILACDYANSEYQKHVAFMWCGLVALLSVYGVWWMFFFDLPANWYSGIAWGLMWLSTALSIILFLRVLICKKSETPTSVTIEEDKLTLQLLSSLPWKLKFQFCLVRIRYYCIKGIMFLWVYAKDPSPHDVFAGWDHFTYPLRIFFSLAISAWLILLSSGYLFGSQLDLLRAVRTLVLQYFGEYTADKFFAISCLIMDLGYAIAYCFVILNWILIFRCYRQHIMLLRQGAYIFKKDDYTTTRAPNYIGYQVMHALVCWFLTYILVVLISLFIVLMVYVDQFRKFVFNLFIILLVPPILSYLINFLLRWLLFSTKTPQLNNFRLFTYFDFLNITLSSFMGFYVVLSRVGIVLGAFFLYLMRLDQPQIGSMLLQSWDSGFT
ncbi:hypothetical protein Pelo_17930 [Pelomyxa schiedti]|nr:hypothetical protein Pelo_17930 [Pelomyxa schiedti]